MYKIVPHIKCLSEEGNAGWDEVAIDFDPGRTFEENLEIATYDDKDEEWGFWGEWTIGFWLLTEEQLKVVKDTWHKVPAGSDSAQDHLDSAMATLAMVFHQHNVEKDSTLDLSGLGDMNAKQWDD